MSTQQIELLSSIPQSDLFELRNSYINTLKYLATRVVGCWHLRMSRPFTRGRETYCACLRCGMRRPFDIQAWRTAGRFYSVSNAWRSDR